MLQLDCDCNYQIKMKVLFVGDVVNKEMEKANPVISAAANNFQLGFLSALSTRCQVDVLTEISRAAWPGSKVLREKHYSADLFEDLKITTIPYINIRFIKGITIMISIARYIRRFFRGNKGNDCYIISYNGNMPFSVPILALRKVFHYKYICLVVDPPLYQGTTKRTGFFYGLLYKAMARSFHKAALKCDECVVLNAYYAKKYLHREDFFVLDCGVSVPEEKNEKTENVDIANDFFEQYSPRKHIVFTGTLHEHSGILRFIDMFLKLKNEFFDLHIWGKGIFEEDIRRIASETDCVFYHGYLPNDEIRQIQRKADFLLCPNSIEHPINKVAFPSKIQEYMLSGIPVIATKVNGLGKDYYPHLYLYDDTFSGLKGLMDSICNSNEQTWKLKGKAAREFIISHKSWPIQVDKMLEYLKHEKLKKG